MSVWSSLVFITYVFVCITLIVLILIQQGKGADAGASFGSSAGSLFGSSGSGNFLTRVTSILAVLFFLLCLAMAHINTQQANIDNQSILGSLSDKEVTESEGVTESIPN